MKAETQKWIQYAQENHQAASLMLDHGLLNLCLQNGQQAVEKLWDSIYLPSRYPLGSAIPFYDPDAAMCRRCLELVEKATASVRTLLK